MTLAERILYWTLRLLAPIWITWTLAGGLLYILARSVEQSAWIPDSGPLGLCLFGGALCGAGLAASSWRGRWAAAYTLLLACAAALQAVGRVVPPPAMIFQLAPLDLLDLLNVRIFALFARLEGWAALYQAGESIRDTGLFLLLFCLSNWLAGAWLGWCLGRTRQALAGLVPVGLLMALNLHFSGQESGWMAAFLLCGLGLLARTALRETHLSWDRRGIDYPEDLGLAWATWAGLFSLVICLAAAAAPLFGTPAGWKILAELTRPARQQVEDAASRIFADVRPPPVSAERLPRADPPQLASVGAPPAQGSSPIFYVSTNDPPPPPAEPGLPAELRISGPRHYWRSQVFSAYSGSGWEQAPLDSQPLADPPAAEQPPPGRYLLSQQFEITSQTGGLLFAANQPVSSPGPAGLRLLFGAGDPQTTLLSNPSGQAVTQYPVASWANRLSAEQLNAASRDYPPEIRALYLQLPTALPQRVANLAGRLVSGAAGPLQAAERIQDYLRLTYTYDTTVPPPPAGRDVADYFLFESQRGFCSYYATAMAVMLRTQGIPARVAAGFANGEYDEDRRAYRVVTGDAHAWVEVYFPGLGWVEFEPTVSQSRIDYPSASAGGTLQPTPVPAPALRLSPGLTAALLAAILALGAGLLFLLNRYSGSRPGGRSANPAALAKTLYRLERLLLAWAGLPASASLTPGEYLARAEPALAERPALLQALELSTRLYEISIYSPHPPAFGEVEAARQAWRKGLGDWLRLAIGRKKH